MSKPTFRDTQLKRRFAKEATLTLATRISMVRRNINERWTAECERLIHAVEMNRELRT